MAEATDKKVIRDTDDEALAMAAAIITQAAHGAIAAFSKNGAFPHISRIQLSTGPSGNLVTLVSSLSGHTACMRADPHCALLLGEAGKGDPLAHPRISIDLIASEVAREDADYATLRESHLAQHPKAKLYVDFGDFSFFKLAPQRASLNGGFGKAYNLTAAELVAAITNHRT